MEVQDLIIRSAVGAAVFPPSARFADVQGVRIERLQAETGAPEWGYGPQHVHVFQEDRAFQCVVQGRQVSVTFEATDDVSEMVNVAGRVFDCAFELLGVRETLFLGARTHWLAAADDFDALNRGLVEAFGRQTNDLAQLFGVPITDAGWSLDFRTATPSSICASGQ